MSEEQLPQSQPGLFFIFGPVVSNTPEPAEPLTHATSELWFHIRISHFSVLTTECNRSSFHPSLQNAERKTLNFCCDVQDFCHTPTLTSALQLFSRAQSHYHAMPRCLTNGSSLWDRLCRPRRQKSLLLVALWIPSWWLTQPPALHSCSPADRAQLWKLILETLLRFKIKTQQFAVQSHWETSFDLMVICYIHFSSKGSLKWWSLFCQQRGRRQ